MNWLDGVIILIILWFAWRGLRVGFTASLAQVMGLTGSLFISFIFYQSLANYLNVQWKIIDKISPWLSMDVFWRPLISSEMERSNELLALSILEILSFLVILMISAYIISTVIYLFLRPAKYIFWGPLGTVGGLVLGAARGIGVVFILMVIFLPEQTKAVSFFGMAQPKWLVIPFQQSRFISLFEPLMIQFLHYF